MVGILKIKDHETGEFVDIPAIKGATGPQGPKGDSIGVITSTIYPGDNNLYQIPSPVTSANIISVVVQSFAKSGYPGTNIIALKTVGGVYGFDIIGFGVGASGLTPYTYNDDSTKGVTVKIYYNLD